VPLWFAAPALAVTAAAVAGVVGLLTLCLGLCVKVLFDLGVTLRELRATLGDLRGTLGDLRGTLLDVSKGSLGVAVAAENVVTACDAVETLSRGLQADSSLIRDGLRSAISEPLKNVDEASRSAAGCILQRQRLSLVHTTPAAVPQERDSADAARIRRSGGQPCGACRRRRGAAVIAARRRQARRLLPFLLDEMVTRV
jgi:hypothetical protein